MEPKRAYLAGVEAISSALDAGLEVRVVLVGSDDDAPEVAALCERAVGRGASIWRGSPGDLRRMSRDPVVPRAMAMLGPSPDADLPTLLGRGGAVILLHRIAYPSNAGFAIRTAEVAGAQGVLVDASFNHDERGRVGHVSMGADKLLPVLYMDSQSALRAAKAHGHRLIAIEDSGRCAPWETDLTGPLVLIVGSERSGIAAEVLADCDEVVRIPMAGFVPSYNLQGALSAVAVERLRQLAYSNHSST